MCASSLSLFVDTQTNCAIILKIDYYKKQSFTTGKNVVHDEKDLAQARSLSLWTRKEMQQLIRK
jgi:HJR/Mrr/RecB family endonuclease